MHEFYARIFCFFRLAHGMETIFVGFGKLRSLRQLRLVVNMHAHTSMCIC